MELKYDHFRAKKKKSLGSQDLDRKIMKKVGKEYVIQLKEIVHKKIFE